MIDLLWVENLSIPTNNCTETDLLLEPATGVSLRLVPALAVVLALPAPIVGAPGAHPSATAMALRGPAGLVSAPPASFDRATWRPLDAGSISPDVLDLALDAAACAIRAGVVQDPATLTIIDYSRPSTARRLWVFDLRSRARLFEELVSHGQGTGNDLATRFSNEPESHQSSLGLFVTAEAYVGKNGYSLRLDGLDRGFNDRARERAIVMHGAPYVSEAFAAAQGRLGRSWGCPAVRDVIARRFIDTVKGGSLVFAYYPDPDFLASSAYLGDCAALAE
jgi:hypothetical protein